MHRRITRTIVGAVALAAATSVAAGTASGGGPAPSAGSAPAGASWSGAAGSASSYGSPGLRANALTADGRLLEFNVRAPGGAGVVGTISGLTGDTRLVGIDYRVQDGRLYGVGDQGGVYTISTADASASKVSQLTVALSGTSFGVDFNPAADRLRIVNDAGQNLRHDVNPGGATTIDGTLTIPPSTAPALGVTGAAYTNNDLDPATATTLFDLDTNLDQVAIQAPANGGQLSPTGKLGVDAAGDVGFDIYSDLLDGTTQAVRGLATIQSGDRTRLYRVSLLTGDATPTGRFPKGVTVVDLAVHLDR